MWETVVLGVVLSLALAVLEPVQGHHDLGWTADPRHGWQSFAVGLSVSRRSLRKSRRLQAWVEVCGCGSSQEVRYVQSNVPWPAIDAIRVAIVVPTHRQPGLLPEALDACFAQDTTFAFAIVLVNDGCPFNETDWACREAAAAHPGRVFYLNRRNGGLSAARNTGIGFALGAFPQLEAVYFLDSA